MGGKSCAFGEFLFNFHSLCEGRVCTSRGVMKALYIGRHLHVISGKAVHQLLFPSKLVERLQEVRGEIFKWIPPLLKGVKLKGWYLSAKQRSKDHKQKKTVEKENITEEKQKAKLDPNNNNNSLSSGFNQSLLFGCSQNKASWVDFLHLNCLILSTIVCLPRATSNVRELSSCDGCRSCRMLCLPALRESAKCD